MKKLILSLVLLLTTLNYTNALNDIHNNDAKDITVLLKNGKKYSLNKVNEVYDALKSLHQAQRGDIVEDLIIACLRNETILKPSYARNNAPHQMAHTRVELASKFNLCDAQGNIDEATAEIILTSADLVIKRNRINYYKLHSPKSLKNYFSWRYLTGKINKDTN